MNQHLLLYDDGCPLCTFQMRLISWLDWFHRIQRVPISSERAQQAAPQLTRESLLEAIHCVSQDGKIYRGARALRFIGWNIPLMSPMSLFLCFPGVIWVAERCYQFVSDRRHVLSKWFGCQGACELLPERSTSRRHHPE